MRVDSNRSNRGFTLIELLITVAIVGLIAAIAIPNFLGALDRGRQKRTMADIRSLASAVETYSVDATIYPVVGTIGQLETIIEPVYIQTAARDDGWGVPFIVDSVSTDYTIGSGGKDAGGLNFIGGATTSFNDAIIFNNGQFVQWPEGSQS
jgi:general secretion pathway protein G